MTPPGRQPVGSAAAGSRATPRRRRILWAVAMLLALPLLAVGLVVFSVWSERHFPSDAADGSAFARVRGVVTKPIVRAIGRHARRRVRSVFEQRMMMTGLSEEETIARFLDEDADLAERRLYAYRLARVGSPAAIEALLAVFRKAPPEHKAFMAQLVGSTGNPDAGPWLLPLLADADERVVIGAIRGLAAIGEFDPEHPLPALFAGILCDPARSEALRIEAALALGQLGTPPARDALVDALHRTARTDLATQVLNGLSSFPFPEVGKTFAEVLDSPATPTPTRVAAVDALANSTSDAVPFLLGLAEHDRDADVRASAAWAIGAHGGGGCGQTLAALAEHEPEADVRRRLYEAVLPGADIPAERLLPTVRAETDVAARVAGFNALGRAVGQGKAAPVAAAFDVEIVPELTRIATSENSLNIRMRAVFALRRARTAAAQEALAIISVTPCPQVAAAARHGLRTSE